MSRIRWSGLLLGAIALPLAADTLYYDSGNPQVRFAAGEIRNALSAKGTAVTEKGLAALAQSAGTGARIVIVAGQQEARRAAATLGVAPLAATAPQAYAIRKRPAGKDTTYAVLGADATGAMYGGLDLAEAIRLNTLAGLADAEHTPHIANRGIKFNIPLDARTPSYSDAGDSATQNVPEMWSMDFWRTFLDEMARDRYNMLSLWSLHPFPSLVKVPEYPDVALADVKRTTASFSHDKHSPAPSCRRRFSAISKPSRKCPSRRRSISGAA